MGEEKHKFEFLLDSDEEGEFCVVPLGGKAAGKFFAKIDVDDYEDIARFNWSGWYSRKKPDRPLYAKRKLLEVEGGDGNRFEMMHRQIMAVKGNVDLDHKNGDGLDNRRRNIRVADVSQNAQNRKKGPNRTSRYKGVSWRKESNKWRVKLGLRGNEICLGNFEREVIDGVDTGEIKAARAYDNAAITYFGSFARLNFPAQRNVVELKDGVYKMSYIMSEQDKKNIEKKVKDIRGMTKNEIFEILAFKEIKEVQDLCHYFNCGIDELVSKIRPQNLVGFKTSEDAINSGKRPCKVCEP
jgi:hypothetical protein